MKSRTTESQTVEKASSYPSITKRGATMKSDVRKRSISVALVVTMILALAFIGIANVNEAGAKNKVNAFKAQLESDGFDVREGAMAQYPMDERCCPDDSKLPCSYFNQASKYMVPFVPIYPGEPPYPPYTSYPGNPVTGAPPNDQWSASWRLRPDEALVLVGTTPPPVRYFGLQTYLFFRYNPNMDPTLPCPPNCYPMQRLWNNFGDQTNQLTIHTAGTPNGAGRNPFNSLTIYIVTADKSINARVRSAAHRAGYPMPIINTEPMPQSLLNLGVGQTADVFNLLFRAALGLGEHGAADLAAYKANPPWRVFRVTPKTPPPATSLDPFPIPEFRAHGTGKTEFYLLPAVEKLRDAILDAYDNDGLVAQEFTSYQGPCHYGLYGFENKVDDIGPSID
ncbi:MAG: hypothetical protein NTV04_19805, partial [Deltaproteobacteria bacterium]|nr:hypothetical protein [Deltaproteobacteria bacterium]